MLKVEVKDGAVRTKTVTSRQSGKQSDIREQDAYAYLGGAYPERITLNLRDRPPYAVGVYVLDASCFFVGQFGKLGVDLGKLKPAPSKAA